MVGHFLGANFTFYNFFFFWGHCFRTHFSIFAAILFGDCPRFMTVACERGWRAGAVFRQLSGCRPIVLAGGQERLGEKRAADRGGTGDGGTRRASVGGRKPT